MKGIIMAGGRASRLGGKKEKALLKIGGKTLLSRAADALAVEGIDEILVAFTTNTPSTHELAEKTGLSVFQTGAEGYHEDIIELLKAFGPFTSLNVDVPFVGRQHVRRLLAGSGEESVAAVVPASIAIREPDADSVGDDGRGRRVIWVGLNYVTRRPRTSLLTFDDPMLTVNINTEEDLAFARRVLANQRAQKSAEEPL